MSVSDTISSQLISSLKCRSEVTLTRRQRARGGLASCFINNEQCWYVTALGKIDCCLLHCHQPCQAVRWTSRLPIKLGDTERQTIRRASLRLSSEIELRGKDVFSVQNSPLSIRDRQHTVAKSHQMLFKFATSVCVWKELLKAIFAIAIISFEICKPLSYWNVTGLHYFGPYGGEYIYSILSILRWLLFCLARAQSEAQGLRM